MYDMHMLYVCLVYNIYSQLGMDERVLTWECR
jgi:hypothetical protein